MKRLQYWPEYLRENPHNASLRFFFDELALLPDRYSVIEAGTKQQFGFPTHHEELFKGSGSFTKIDVEEGKDVDKVVDIHEASKVLGEESTDVFWASSVWEHLHSPWIAAEEVLRLLKPRGLFFIQTHLVFPEHGFPNDYFRFTTQALKHLFRNAEKTVACYEYECAIEPQDKKIVWNAGAPAYLNVNIAGVK